MKSCPTCNRTFEDTLTYCLIDGSILDAPFDPQATLVIPEPRQTEPPPTEVIRPVEEKEIPPTIASPEPQRKQQESELTIASPEPSMNSPQLSPSHAQPARKSNQRLWIIGGILVLLIVGITIAFVKRATDRTRANASERAVVKPEADDYYQHYSVGAKLFNDQKYAEAEAELREAVRLKPDFYPNHYLLGRVLEEQKKYAEAEAEYREALRLKPGDSSIKMSLDGVLAAQGKQKSSP